MRGRDRVRGRVGEQEPACIATLTLSLSLTLALALSLSLALALSLTLARLHRDAVVLAHAALAW